MMDQFLNNEKHESADEEKLPSTSGTIMKKENVVNMKLGLGVALIHAAHFLKKCVPAAPICRLIHPINLMLMR